MSATIDISGLPVTLALIIRPWGGVLQTAPPGMGENVRVTVGNASTSLWRRVIMLPKLERGLAEALSASAVLANTLDKEGTTASEARSDALLALDALIVLLHDARPNARAMGLGLGW
jgi:hypothetical protein